MKLYVDDIREAPDGWVVAMDYLDAINILSYGGIIDAISLDHDLGENSRSGYEICKWMVEHDVWPELILIHTANPVGRDNMLQLLRRYAPEGVRIY